MLSLDLGAWRASVVVLWEATVIPYRLGSCTFVSRAADFPQHESFFGSDLMSKPHAYNTNNIHSMILHTFARKRLVTSYPFITHAAVVSEATYIAELTRASSTVHLPHPQKTYRSFCAASAFGQLPEDQGWCPQGLMASFTTPESRITLRPSTSTLVHLAASR
ncbi:hypothetical protein AB1N83_001606 [Pleurotus pulmonarius]